MVSNWTVIRAIRSSSGLLSLLGSGPIIAQIISTRHSRSCSTLNRTILIKSLPYSLQPEVFCLYCLQLALPSLEYLLLEECVSLLSIFRTWGLMSKYILPNVPSFLIDNALDANRLHVVKRCFHFYGLLIFEIIDLCLLRTLTASLLPSLHFDILDDFILIYFSNIVSVISSESPEQILRIPLTHVLLF